MTHQFINPDYHVILIHYPLGVFVMGVALELGGFLWRKSSVRLAARWMILLGGLSSLIVATSGIYALSDVHQKMTEERYHFLKMHVILTSVASLLAVLTVVFGLGASDRWRRKFHLPMLVALVATWGLFVGGAWFAGETVYSQGTGVVIEKHTKAKQVSDAIGEAPGTQPASEPAPEVLTRGEQLIAKIHFFAGPTIQLHMIDAGAAFAIAFGALGLSIRKITSMYPDAPIVVDPIPEDGAAHAGTPEAEDMVRSFSPAPEFAAPIVVEEAFLPAARWWLLGALVAISTALLGYWIWAEGRDTIGLNAFWEDLLSVGNKPVFTRAALHVWVGVLIIVFSLILAMLARWAGRSPIPLTIFSVLLVLAIAAQVWLGILLQFDGQEGPITGFSKDKESASAIYRSSAPGQGPIAGAVPLALTGQ